MKFIIEREATFKNKSDIEVKVTQNKSSQAFIKETHLLSLGRSNLPERLCFFS